ncbi:MAG: ECF-type sigma factor [Longimicrobiales bacterium]|nr:ECF-type sigma factor [Longimicrobiales bacterium]
MDPNLESDVTLLLRSMSAGDRQAIDRLIPLVYEELRAIAHRRMSREQDGHTLNATAVVHEAYVRLAQQNELWRDRAHFFAVASRVMRHILIDHARARSAEKRGGSPIPVPLAEGSAREDPRFADILELDQALARLGEMDPRLEQVVECRFYGGLSMDETAEAIGISVRSANRYWRRARAYLYDMLAP